MKRIATLVLTTLSVSLHAAAQGGGAMLEKPRVDPGVELMSVVWRLAGKPEYSRTDFKLYTDRIENHFGAHKDHALVEFARSLTAEHGISHDAIASMGVHLDIGRNLRRDVTATSLESRWKNVDKDKFTTLLKQFAADTRFDEFYDANAELYTEASGRFETVSDALDLKWYADFFGTEPREKFVIVNGLGNGGANYATRVEYSDGRKEIHAVMGAWTVDETGMIVFSPDDYLPTLIHEFNHSFVNDLNAGHREKFEDCGERLFAVYGEVMRRQAYSSWELMLNEALVRAVVIMYMKDHGATPEQLAAMVRNESRNHGFQWTGAILAELDEYAAARDQYPTLDDFMPRLAEAYIPWVEQVEAAVSARAQPLHLIR
jgi:hypothetical protein